MDDSGSTNDGVSEVHNHREEAHVAAPDHAPSRDTASSVSSRRYRSRTNRNELFEQHDWDGRPRQAFYDMDDSDLFAEEREDRDEMDIFTEIPPERLSTRRAITQRSTQRYSSSRTTVGDEVTQRTSYKRGSTGRQETERSNCCDRGCLQNTANPIVAGASSLLRARGASQTELTKDEHEEILFELPITLSTGAAGNFRHRSQRSTGSDIQGNSAASAQTLRLSTRASIKLQAMRHQEGGAASSQDNASCAAEIGNAINNLPNSGIFSPPSSTINSSLTSCIGSGSPVSTQTISDSLAVQNRTMSFESLPDELLTACGQSIFVSDTGSSTSAGVHLSKDPPREGSTEGALHLSPQAGTSNVPQPAPNLDNHVGVSHGEPQDTSFSGDVSAVKSEVVATVSSCSASTSEWQIVVSGHDPKAQQTEHINHNICTAVAATLEVPLVTERVATSDSLRIPTRERTMSEYLSHETTTETTRSNSLIPGLSTTSTTVDFVALEEPLDETPNPGDAALMIPQRPLAPKTGRPMRALNKNMEASDTAL